MVSPLLSLRPMIIDIRFNPISGHSDFFARLSPQSAAGIDINHDHPLYEHLQELWDALDDLETDQADSNGMHWVTRPTPMAKGWRQIDLLGRMRIPEFREKRAGEKCTCTDLTPIYPGAVDKCLACGRDITGETSDEGAYAGSMHIDLRERGVSGVSNSVPLITVALAVTEGQELVYRMTPGEARMVSEHLRMLAEQAELSVGKQLDSRAITDPAQAQAQAQDSGFILYYKDLTRGRLSEHRYRPEDGYGIKQRCFESILDRIESGIAFKIEEPIKLCNGHGELVYDADALKLLVSERERSDHPGETSDEVT